MYGVREYLGGQGGGISLAGGGGTTVVSPYWYWGSLGMPSLALGAIGGSCRGEAL
jgi:hypothetical protein